MDNARKMLFLSALLAFLCLAIPASAEINAKYLYNLSDFTGTVPTSSARVSLDAVNKEVYVTTGDRVVVFNDKGMEIYRFGEDLNIGTINDVAIDEKGNIYVLSNSYELGRFVITLCNYRGEPIREIEITNTPDGLGGFFPNRILYRNGVLYLVAENAMTVVIIDANGAFRNSVDLFPLLDLTSDRDFRQAVPGMEKPERKRQDYTISGFNLDHEGNMLFTDPITAKAYVISPDLIVDSFGQRGSAPGRFAVPRSMARDRSGNYLVCDILRAVAMVFDKDFEFVTEFGFRGYGPGNLIGPTGIAVDEDSRVYITQLADRGVSVYQLKSD
jgi:DNA-binding beta-propeller fold protein YncE